MVNKWLRKKKLSFYGYPTNMSLSFLIVVIQPTLLSPVKDCRIPVCELSSTVFAFVDLPHPMALTLVKIISMQIF